MANISYGVNILPKTNNTYTLGNSDYKWSNIYSTSLNVGDINITGSLSRGRAANTTVGLNSFVYGENLTVTGANALAFGYGHYVSGTQAHAEGTQNIAIGNASLVSGSNNFSFYPTEFVAGQYNYSEDLGTWISGTSYSVGDKVSYSGYVLTCVEANSDVGEGPTVSKWAQDFKSLLTVGNGADNNNRSNAFQVQYSGDVKVKGDVYVNCNANSSGGTKLLVSTNPVTTGSFSHNRKASTTVGTNSVAIGDNCEASAEDSFAEGRYTTANGYYSHAEGNYTTASGMASHAEGTVTVANHASQHVFGEYNTADGSNAASYNRGNYVEIVGNGTSSTTSNARVLDWSGNEKLKGTLYVGCNADSSGGTEVATKSDVSTLSDQIAKKVKIVSVQTTIPSGGTQAEFTVTLPSAEPNTNYVPFVFGRGGNTAYIPVFTVASWTTTQITGVVYNCGVSTAVATRDVHVMLVR